MKPIGIFDILVLSRRYNKLNNLIFQLYYLNHMVIVRSLLQKTERTANVVKKNHNTLDHMNKQIVIFEDEIFEIIGKH